MAEILKEYSYMALPSSIKRGNPAPLDVSEIWFSYEEMAAYAATNATAYVGQQMALVDEVNNTATAYIILNAAGDLQEIGAGVLTDDLTVELNPEGELALHDFGKAFYKYIPEEKNEETGEVTKEAGYEKVVVSESNPWKAGLEPRVVLEGEDLVLGWFEPNPTTIEGVNNQVTAVQGTVSQLDETLNAEGGLVDQVEDLQEEIGHAATEAGNDATGLYAELDKKADAEAVEEELAKKADADAVTEELGKKANAEDVYDKNAVDGLISGVNTEVAKKANSADVYTKSEVDGFVSTINGNVDKKADADTVYTIAQADKAIADAVAGADHLKRKIMGSVEEVEAYAADHADATQYIFMVSNGLQADDNRYYEYMVFEIAGEEGADPTRVVERVGNWAVDLSGYATTGALENLTQTVADNKSAIEQSLADEIARADAAEKANAEAAQVAKDAADAAQVDATQALADVVTEKERAEAAEKALGERIDAIDFVDDEELAEALAPYAKTADVNTTLADYAKSEDVTSALNEKADKATTLEGYGITNAYTKAEADKAIADKVAAVTGGESAAAVKLLLEAEVTRSTEKDNAHDASIESILEKLNGIASGAEVNVIASVDENEFSLSDDKLLSLNKVAASKVTGLAEHEALTSLKALIDGNAEDITGLNESVEDIEARLNNYVLTSVYDAKMESLDADIAHLKNILTWKEV